MTLTHLSHRLIVLGLITWLFASQLFCISAIAVLRNTVFCIFASQFFASSHFNLLHFNNSHLRYHITLFRISNFSTFRLSIIFFFYIRISVFYISQLSDILFFLRTFIWILFYLFSSFRLRFFAFVFSSWLQTHQYVLWLLNELFINLQSSRFHVSSSILMVMVSYFMILISIWLICSNRTRFCAKTLICQMSKKWIIYFTIVTWSWESFFCDFRKSCCICVKSMIKILLNMNSF